MLTVDFRAARSSSSTCGCDPRTGGWTCTADCRNDGVCVPAEEASCGMQLGKRAPTGRRVPGKAGGDRFRLDVRRRRQRRRTRGQRLSVSMSSEVVCQIEARLDIVLARKRHTPGARTNSWAPGSSASSRANCIARIFLSMPARRPSSVVKCSGAHQLGSSQIEPSRNELVILGSLELEHSNRRNSPSTVRRGVSAAPARRSSSRCALLRAGATTGTSKMTPVG
jgi:hypothetical protein